MRKKIELFIVGLVTISSLTGCYTKSKEEIEKSFDKVLSVYPTKNLEDFYDMEGYRDSEFDEEDKGVWILDSSMSVSESEDSALVTEGMILQLNRNTRKAKGYYYVMTTWNDLSKPVKEDKYPVIFEGNEFKLVEDISNESIKEKIKNFQFFVQYGNFQKLDTYKNIKKMYNLEVPMYQLEYQLTNEDSNVKALRSKYNVPTNKAPTLLLSGSGDLEGSSVGNKELDFIFDKEGIDIFFNDSIDFRPETRGI